MNVRNPMTPAEEAEALIKQLGALDLAQVRAVAFFVGNVGKSRKHLVGEDDQAKAFALTSRLLHLISDTAPLEAVPKSV